MPVISDMAYFHHFLWKYRFTWNSHFIFNSGIVEFDLNIVYSFIHDNYGVQKMLIKVTHCSRVVAFTFSSLTQYAVKCPTTRKLLYELVAFALTSAFPFCIALQPTHYECSNIQQPTETNVNVHSRCAPINPNYNCRTRSSFALAKKNWR